MHRKHQRHIACDPPRPLLLSGSSPSPDEGERDHPLSEAAEAALETLVEGFSTAEHMRDLAGVEAPPEGVTADLVLQRLPFGEDATAELRRLAGDLARRGVGDPGAPTDDVLAERATALHEALDRAGGGGPGGGARAPRRRSERDRVLAEVMRLIREISLEELDVDVRLAPRRGQTPPKLLAERVAEATAQGRLLDRLLARLEASTLGHELLRVEWEASAWWFRRWSVDPAPEAAFARFVREREWSLVERGTLFMGPVLDNFVGRGFAAQLPARQRRLAQALQASFAGVFVVEQRKGELGVLREIETGRRFEVIEHAPATPWETGWVGLGRLYAQEGGRHLRSPGMVLLDVVDATAGDDLAEAFRRGKRQLAPALALEALVSAVTRDGPLPRPVSAAHSRAEAGHWVERATRALAASGLVEDTEPDSGGGPRVGDEEVPTRRYKVDAAVGQWLGELFETAQKPQRPGPARARGGGRRRSGS